MIDLKARYGDHYRIRLDESATIKDQPRSERLWYYQIPCRYGHIFLWGANELGAHTNGRQRKRRLMAIPGVRVRQEGDREVNVSFPPELLEQVAGLLQARKRPVLSPEELERRRQRGRDLAQQKRATQ